MTEIIPARSPIKEGSHLMFWIIVGFSLGYSVVGLIKAVSSQEQGAYIAVIIICLSLGYIARKKNNSATKSQPQAME